MRDFPRVPDLVQLTLVGSQGEADVLCSFLKAHGINGGERAANLSAERGAGSGGWREILVGTDDLDAARELVADANSD